MSKQPIFGPGGILPCKPGDHNPARAIDLKPYRGVLLQKYPCGEVVANVAPHDWWKDEEMAHEFIDMWSGNKPRHPNMTPQGGWPQFAKAPRC
jgi:hypothetical protein